MPFGTYEDMTKTKETKMTPDRVLLEKRILYFHADVSTYSVEKMLIYLEYLNLKSSKPIQLNICSPGGSVDAGLGLYDYIKSSRSKINTHCTGLAASMGAILLAGGAKRTATRNARIMIHQPSSGFIGKATDIENHANEISRVRKLLSTLISADTGQPFNKVNKDMNEDLWMTAEEALKYGLIDKIV